MSPGVRMVGINHVALEVADLEAATEFYSRAFAVEGIEREPGMVFLAMGDQFLALSEGRTAPPDADRHFGLVVDDKEAAREALREAGAEVLPGHRLDVRDPWGNRLQIVDYRDIQFTTAPAVLAGMGLTAVRKRPAALRELRDHGLLDESERS